VLHHSGTPPATAANPVMIYTPPVQALTGPAAILAACDHHPLARFGVGLLAAPTGFTENGGTLFFGRARGELVTGFFLGRPDRIGELIDQARGARLLDHLGWINLPRDCPLPPGFEVRDEWDFRWATRAPASQAGQEAVADLPNSADREVDALLDLAMPDTTVRPGHPSARQWYGVRDGDVLVACGADRSGGPSSPAPVGVLGAIAVHPAHRGRGYGTAVSAAITTRLFDEYDLVTLGVWPDNHRAIRIYERLGYTGRTEITSTRPSP
jgi:ribosomal protein S18 acetylase RimI-like enzyme